MESVKQALWLASVPKASIPRFADNPNEERVRALYAHRFARLLASFEGSRDQALNFRDRAVER